MNRLCLMMICLIGLMIGTASAEEGRRIGGDPLDPVPIGLRPAQASDRLLSLGTEFNPAISLILDLVYVHMTEDLDSPPGFDMAGHDHGHGHGHGHSHGLEDGFNFRGVELTLSGTVDPYFDAEATLHFTDHDVEVEEAFFVTRMLPSGLQIKGGKFLSDVGYINKQHMHDWLFVDQPWMREYFFGSEGLNELGVQLSWLPPTQTYMRFGVEVLEGESEGVANQIGEGRHEIVTLTPDAAGAPSRNRWRADTDLREKTGPRLFTGFAKVAPDLGQNHAAQFGFFGGYSRVHQASEAHSSGRLETWDGDGWFAGGDFVYKYDGQGAMGHRNFILQGEYIYRELDLAYKSREFAGFSNFVTTDANNQRWQQDGLYVQAVYGFAPRWNAGARVDVLGIQNDGFEGRGRRTDFGASYRYTGQVSYSPTEFSRIRLQASYMDLAHDDHGHDDHHDGWQLALQFNMSLGAHGAHSF